MALRDYGQASANAIPVGDINRPIVDWGADFYSDTSLHNGDWIGFLCLTDAVIDLTGVNWGGSVITAVTVKAGTYVPGRFNTLKLASGTIIAYRASQPAS